MILTIILGFIFFLIISIHFSAKYLAQVQKNYYGIFVVFNIVVFVAGVWRIYYLDMYVWDDPKGVGFWLWTLIFMVVQIVLVLLVALIANPLIKWWKKREAEALNN
ncbi:hypothetical protein [Emticicia fontis]